MKGKLLGMIPVATLLLLSACSGGDHAQADKMMADHKAMMVADSTAKAGVAAQEATVQAITDLFNSHSTDGIEGLMTDNFVDHQMPASVTTPGIAGVKEEMAAYFTAFPDMKQEILGIATKGDRTYFQVRMTGTSKGPWAGMPATDKSFDVMGCDVIRFENGKAAEHWGYMEEMKMMQQLGLMPAPGAKPEKK